MQSLSGADLFAQAMMLRGVDSRLIIILEGGADCGVLDPHLDEKSIQTVPGFGKESVLQACRLAEQHAVAEILGLVDADFDVSTGKSAQFPANVIITQHYDLDADIIFACPEILDRIAANFSDRSKWRADLRDFASTTLDMVADVAEVVGHLRHVSVIHGLGLNLDRFPVEHLVAGFGNIDLVSEAITTAIARSGGSVSVGVLSAQSRMHWRRLRREDLVNGHDAAKALATFIRVRWSGHLGAEMCEKTIRTSIDCAKWSSTGVFRQVAAWALGFGRRAWTC